MRVSENHPVHSLYCAHYFQDKMFRLLVFSSGCTRPHLLNRFAAGSEHDDQVYLKRTGAWAWVGCYTRGLWLFQETASPDFPSIASEYSATTRL
jgi:hypothetical protein